LQKSFFTNRLSVLEGKAQEEKIAERTYGTRACFFDEATQPSGTLSLLGKKKGGCDSASSF
jgi:hypothetical protein